MIRRPPRSTLFPTRRSSDLLPTRRGAGARHRLYHRGLPFPSSPRAAPGRRHDARSEEHTSELQSRLHLVCRLLLEKKKKEKTYNILRASESSDLKQESNTSR